MSRNRINTVEYFVERWDETVYLKEMTANQLSKIAKLYSGDENGEVDQVKIMTEMLYMSLVDEKGDRLLSKKELGEMSGVVFMELAEKAGDLNNMGSTSSASKEKEALLKNQ